MTKYSQVTNDILDGQRTSTKCQNYLFSKDGAAIDVNKDYANKNKKSK